MFFLIRFLFISLILFSIIENINPISSFLNEFQTNITMYFLSIFIDNDLIEGTIVNISKTYRVLVSNECNGLLPIVALFSAILSYTAPIGHKLKYLLITYLLYTVLNIFRILIIIFIAFDYGSESFFLSHDILGNALLILFGLGSFFVFVKTSKKYSNLSLN